MGESVQIHRHVRTGTRKSPRLELFATGIVFQVEPREFISEAGRSVIAAHYPIDALPCPDCGAYALKLGFEDGEPCPQCKRGTITAEFIEY